MARGKAKTTQDKLDSLLEKKGKLLLELQSLEDEITNLTEHLKQEKINQLVEFMAEKGMTVDDVIATVNKKEDAKKETKETTKVIKEENK